MTPQEIKDLRLALGRTQAGLAEILGATELSVYRWEKGKARPIDVYMRKLRTLQEWVAGQQGGGE